MIDTRLGEIPHRPWALDERLGNFTRKTFENLTGFVTCLFLWKAFVRISSSSCEFVNEYHTFTTFDSQPPNEIANSLLYEPSVFHCILYIPKGAANCKLAFALVMLVNITIAFISIIIFITIANHIMFSIIVFNRRYYDHPHKLCSQSLLSSSILCKSSKICHGMRAVSCRSCQCDFLSRLIGTYPFSCIWSRCVCSRNLFC
jgi:hypothetical protein